jgi:hypothetical protein
LVEVGGELVDVGEPFGVCGAVWTVPGFMDTGLGGEFVNASIA